MTSLNIMHIYARKQIWKENEQTFSDDGPVPWFQLRQVIFFIVACNGAVFWTLEKNNADNTLMF